MLNIFLIFSLLFFYSCNGKDSSSTNTVHLANNQENNQINNSGSVSNEIGVITGEELIEQFTIPLQDGDMIDILDWFRLFKKDRVYFIQERGDDLSFFDLWSDYLYGTNYTNGKYRDLFLCIKSGDYQKLEDEWSRSVCKGEDKFILPERENYSHIKNNLILFKKSSLGEKVSLRNLEEYIITNILSGKYKSEGEVIRAVQKYNKIYSDGNCQELNHDTLVTDCTNEYKKNS